MKKPSLIFITLLLVSLVSMTALNPVLTNPAVTQLEVIPSSKIDNTLLPQTAKIIRPMADGTFTNWTRDTLTIRPDSDGTYGELTGRTLALNPNGTGSSTQWSSRTYLIPNGEGNWSQWYGSYGMWDDWPNPDDDSTYCRATASNQNKTSDFPNPSAERRVVSIDKVTVSYRAKQTTGDEKVQAILNSMIDLNVTGRDIPSSGWDDWTRVGSSPWLDNADYPSKYINTSVSNDKIGNFTFADLAAGLIWNTFTGTWLRLRTWQRGGGENDTLKIYVYNGTKWTTYSFTPSRTIGAYADLDVHVALSTRAAVNAAKIAIEKVTDTDNVPDNIYVDYACIRLFGLMNSACLGTAFTPGTTSYTNYTGTWTTNPITGSAWTWSDIDNLQAGVRSIAYLTWSGEIRVTQLYITVFSGALYVDWDDWPDHNGDTDYNYVGADAMLQSSALKNHTTETWSIAKVKVSMVARSTTPTDDTLQLMLGIPPFEFKLNVSGFDNAWTGWTRVPPGTTGPWLDNADYPSNYISSAVAGDQIGNFTFADVTGVTFSGVTLSIRTWRVGDDTLTIYLYDGATWTSTTVTPPTLAAPGSYVDWDVSDFLDTAAKVNAAKMAIKYVKGSGPAQTIGVDYAYLCLSRAYYGTPTTVTTSYVTYSSEWTTSPATGLAWTWSEINATEVGVKSTAVGAWSGEVRVTQLYVKVIEYGTYQHWDDSPAHNGDTDYISAAENAKSQSSNLQNHVSEGWGIFGVQVSIVARTDVSTNEGLQIMLVVYGTRCYSPSFTLTTTYSTYSYVWPKNARWPTINWNWTTIDDLQAGVYSVQSGSWVGEIRITQLYVVVGASGTYTDWDDSPSPNGDTDYVSATMADLPESSALEDIDPDPSWDIARVRVVIVAKATSATDEKILPMLVVGGLTCPGPTEAEYTLTTAYATYTWDWGKNPRWPIPWNWTAIDALEAGVKSLLGDDKVWTGEIRVTQLYVEIAGPRFTVDIRVTDVTDLKAYEFFLNYTTGTLSATAIILGPFLQIDPQKPPQIWLEKINDTAGYLYYSVSVAAGASTGSGTGTLATIIFLVDHYYDSPLDLDKTALRDSYNMLIDHDTTDGYFMNRLRGDVNGNNEVESSDLSSLNDHYGSVPGESEWDLACDFNHDGKIDLSDLFDLGKNYGKSWPG